MFTDSHCHLTFTELLSQLPAIRQAMQEAKAERARCICPPREAAPYTNLTLPRSNPC